MADKKKKDPVGRGWQFTDFCRKSTEKDWQIEDVQFVQWGEEVCPETKREHRQGLVWFKKNCARTAVQKLVGDKCHCELIKKPKALESYNAGLVRGKKANEKVFSWGEPVGAGHRTDISAAYAFAKGCNGDIKKLADQVPVEYMKYHGAMDKVAKMNTATTDFRKLDTTILHGVGGTGKSSWAAWKFGKDNVFVLKQSAWEGKFWDGYYAQDVLQLEFDQGPFMKYQDFLNVVDGHPYWVNIKHGGTWAKWTKVVIASNEDPRDWWKNVFDKHKNAWGAFVRRITRVCTVTEPMPHLANLRVKAGTYVLTRLL